MSWSTCIYKRKQWNNGVRSLHYKGTSYSASNLGGNKKKKGNLYAALDNLLIKSPVDTTSYKRLKNLTSTVSLFYIYDCIPYKQ